MIKNREYRPEESHRGKNRYVLEVKGLSKTYGDFQLKDVRFVLPVGCIMGFLGKNGAGKSTTMKAIMDLIPTDRGDIRILGMRMPEKDVAIKEQVGYVSDTPLLNERWTVERTLQFVRHFYRHWDDEAVKKHLKLFQIPVNKKVAQLSKGMKVKFSLVLAIAHRPKLLLLDEPTSGLDPVAREEVLDVLLAFVRDGSRSVLFSSHITSDVEKIADAVTLIDNGRILLSEDKESLLDRHRRIIIPDAGRRIGDDKQDVNDQNITQEMNRDDVHHPLLFNFQRTKGGYVAYTSRYAELYAREKQRLDAGEWRAERLTLEEVFILLTGKREA